MPGFARSGRLTGRWCRTRDMAPVAVLFLHLVTCALAFEVRIESPPGFFDDARMDVLHGDFGQSPSGTITAPLVAADDPLACSVDSLKNAAALNGSIAIARRGACSFQVKLNSLMAVGARAALIVQTLAVASPVPVIMTAINYGVPVSLDVIPGAMISSADGNRLIDALAHGTNITVSFASAPAVPADIAVLAELYDKLGGAGWQYPYGWRDNPRGNPCVGRGWFGVRCNSLGRVHALNIPKMGLVGSLPSSLATLTELRTLYISSNAGLVGPVPDFGVFPEMRMLEISGTGLSGSLPASMGTLVRLKYLKGDDTRVSGAVPAGLLALPRLQYLSFAQCAFSGQMPTSWNLPSLKFLSLQGNRFDGAIPSDAFSTLVSLQTLDISNNLFSGSVPQFKNLTALQTVSLRNNRFSTIDSAGIGTTFVLCPKLTVLDLGINNLSGAFFSVAGIPAIEQLDVSQNAFSGPLHDSLSGALSLKALVAARNRLTAPLPAGLFNLRFLERVDMSSNLIDADFSSIFIGLVGASPLTLTSLDLSSNRLFGSIEFTTQAFLKLSVFDVSKNRLSGAVYGTLLANFEKLEYLDLSSNQFVGAIPQMIGRLSNLRFFSIANNTGLAAPALPSFVQPTSTFARQPGTYFECPTLIGPTDKLQVYIDHKYDSYQLCKCETGYYGAVPDCRPCITDALCGVPTNTSLATTMVAPRGTYPLPFSRNPKDWVMLAPCSKLSRGEVQCNPTNVNPYECAEGYEDRLCSRCSTDFYREGFVCTPCDKDLSRFWVGVFVVAAIFWFVGVALVDGYSFFGQAAKSAFLASQIVAIIIGRTAFHWPDSIYASSRAIAWTLFNPESITCLVSVSPTGLLAYRVLLPLVTGCAAGVILALFYVLASLICWKAGNSRATPVVRLGPVGGSDADGATSAADNGTSSTPSRLAAAAPPPSSNRRGSRPIVSRSYGGGTWGFLLTLLALGRDRLASEFRARWARVFLMILDLCYIPILFGIVNAFSCESDALTGQQYSRHFPWLECDGSAYRAMLGIAIASLVCYILGIPVAFIALIRASLSPGISFARRRTLVTVSSFVTDPYHAGCRYYEIVHFVKRVFFVVLSASNIGSYYTGVVFVFLVLAASLGIQTLLRPYNDPRMNRLETVAGYVELLAIVSGVIFSSDVLAGSVVTCQAITFTIGCVLMTAYPVEVALYLIALRTASGRQEPALVRHLSHVVDPMRRISLAWMDNSRPASAAASALRLDAPSTSSKRNSVHMEVPSGQQKKLQVPDVPDGNDDTFAEVVDYVEHV